MSLAVVVVICLGVTLSFRALTGKLARPWLASGSAYMLIGLALGPSMLGLVTPDHLHAAQPILSMALGALGFSLGLTLRSELRGGRPPLETLLAAGLVVVTVGGALLALLDLAYEPGTSDAALVATLAALAAVSGEPTIRATARRLGATGPAPDDLAVRAHTSTIGAVLLFGGALSYARGSTGSTTETEWLVLAIVAGVSCGGLHALFTRSTTDNDRVLIATIGVVTLASGLASGMGISALFVNVVVGAVVGSTTLGATVLPATIERFRGPTEVILLVAAGASASAVSGWAWAIPAAWLLFRAVAWQMAPTLAEALVEGSTRGRRLGPALATFGPIGAAVCVNHAQVLPEQAGIVTVATFAALFLSDAMGAVAVRRVLADLGAVDHGAPAADAPVLPASPVAVALAADALSHASAGDARASQVAPAGQVAPAEPTGEGGPAPSEAA